MRGETKGKEINPVIEALCVLKCGNVLARVHLDNWSGNRRGGISKAKGTILLTGWRPLYLCLLKRIFEYFSLYQTNGHAKEFIALPVGQ
ncbi:hypothetical protein TNIN_410551 [Trichonephila inaurata madagascariensis]|uniref:Uncharacterized protein n=1 Tax=Trichonephila inaurata madagascariensis TaxID=2747483 RepID=A0A8X6XVB0_9ARAC|nr:hypothetical protein TNIN_410551 [Trichonephila inaurata madagascariensis]